MKYHMSITISENNKNYAFAESFNEGSNLFYILSRIKNCNIVVMCSSRKKAEQKAAEWNKSYMENGTYYIPGGDAQ